MFVLESEGDTETVAAVRRRFKELLEAGGYRLEMVAVDGEGYAEAVERGASDFIISDSEVFSRRLDGYLRKYSPLVAPDFRGDKTYRFCLYGAGKSGGIKGLSRANIEITSFWHGYGDLARFLREAGVNQNAGEYFGNVRIVKKTPDALRKLAAGKVDAIFERSSEVEPIIEKGGEFGLVKEIACSESYYNSPVLYRKNLPDGEVEELRELLTGKSWRPAARKTDPGFERVSEGDYERLGEIIKAGIYEGKVLEIYEAITPMGYEETYEAPEDIFRGKLRGFVEVEKALGKGRFEKALRLIRNLRQSRRDARLLEIEKQTRAIFEGRGVARERSECGVNMVFVPAGEFTMGSDAPVRDEASPRKVFVGDFCMDVYEYPNVEGVRPRTAVGWNKAKSLCREIGKRMPTSAEWEKAARGANGRIYPWGGEWRAGRANTFGAEDGYERLAPSGGFPAGESPYGVRDMAGNLWEMVFDRDFYSGAGKKPGDGIDIWVLRGGSWSLPSMFARTHVHNWYFPDYHDNKRGFRCAADVVE